MSTWWASGPRETSTGPIVARLTRSRPRPHSKALLIAGEVDFELTDSVLVNRQDGGQWNDGFAIQLARIGTPENAPIADIRGNVFIGFVGEVSGEPIDPVSVHRGAIINLDFTYRNEFWDTPTAAGLP